MTVNDLKFVNLIVEYDERISDIQDYITEQFNIDTIYNKDENTLHLFTNDIKKTKQLTKAKDYVIETLGEGLVDIIYGK